MKGFGKFICEGEEMIWWGRDVIKAACWGCHLLRLLVVLCDFTPCSQYLHFVVHILVIEAVLCGRILLRLSIT